MELSEILDEYIVFARAARRSENTITSMRYHVRRLTAFLEQRGRSTDADDLSPRDLREFVAELHERYALKTVANNVRAIKTLLAFAVREELIDHDPSRRVSVPSVPRRDLDTLSPEDVERLLRACNRDTLIGLRDFAIVLLLYESGIRASELTGLRDEAIDWHAGLITVHGKGDRSRTVPVSGRTLRTLRRYVNARRRRFPNTDDLFLNHVGEPMTPSGLLQMLQRLGERTGLHVHPHKLRHSFAVNALRNDVSLVDIQDSLGHTTLAMTRHYARQLAVELVRRHKRFSPANQLKVRI